jgi:DNA-binding Lrp family transcriptional regulator
MVFEDKYLPILQHFRLNSRVRLTDLSKKTQIPVSTLFEKLKYFEENNLISKHTSLLNFRELGYDVRTQLLIKAVKKDDLQKYLTKHQSVNNIYRVNNGFDFLIEAVFENISAFDKFLKELDSIGIEKSEEFFVLEDLKREGFMEFNPLFNN